MSEVTPTPIRRRSRRRRRLAIGLAVALAVGAGAFGFVRWRDASTPPPATSQRTEVRRGTLEASVSSSGNVVMPHQAKLTFGNSDISGVVKEVLVNRGDTVTATQPLVRLDDQDLRRAEEKAKADLSTAQLNLQKLVNQYTAADIQNAQGAVRNAETTLENAKRSLEVAQNSESVAKTVRDAKYQMNWYETDYGEALRLFNEGSISQSDLDLRRNNYYTAKERYETAQLSAQNSIASARNDVKKAEDTLATARQDLADKQKGADPTDVQIRQLAITNAQAAWETAKENLNNATLVAPFGGTIADIPAKVGERLASGGTAVQLVDTSQIRVDALLDEVDAPKVKPGQDAKLAFDSLPDVSLPAKVDFLSPIGTQSQGVVNFQLKLSVASYPPEVPMREGISALATITVAKRENVLLVPNRALRVVGGQYTVSVPNSSGQPETRNVAIGLANDQFTEITRGLQEGDAILVPTGGAQTARTGGMPGFVPGR